MRNFIILFVFSIINTAYANGFIKKNHPITSPIDILEKNDFKYSYHDGKLIRGSTHLGIIMAEYDLNLTFDESNYLKQISLLPTTFGYQYKIISFDLSCKETFEDEKYCHVSNVYNTTPKEYPERTQIKMKKSFQDVFEENLKDGAIVADFPTQLNFLAHHLRLNNFSDAFVDQLLIAAKKNELESL